MPSAAPSRAQHSLTLTPLASLLVLNLMQTVLNGTSPVLSFVLSLVGGSVHIPFVSLISIVPGLATRSPLEKVSVIPSV